VKLKLTKTINLLIIDDNTADAEHLTRLLNKLLLGPVNIQSYTTLNKALFFALDADLIISDLRLPPHSKTEAISKLREYFPGTPILAFSGSENPAIAFEAGRVGAQGFLSKKEMETSQFASTILCALGQRELSKTRGEEDGK
jgi:two-component system, NarL family, nitrate/nitrite response regulator NarL